MSYMARVVLAVLAWRIFWLVVHAISGFYISYISINNGLSINGISVDKKARVSASSLRFRLWGNSRRIIISDLVLRLPPSTRKSSTSSPGDISVEPLTVYPKSRLGGYFIRFIIFAFRSADIELKSPTIIHEKFELEADSLLLQLKSAPLKNGYAVNVSLMSTKTQASVNPSARKELSSSIGSAAFSMSCCVDHRSGLVSKSNTRINIDEAEINVFQPLKAFFSSEVSTDNKHQEQRPKHDAQETMELLTKIHTQLYSSFDKLTINLSNCAVKGVPILEPSIDYTISDYLSQDDPTKSLYLFIGAVSVNVGKVSNSAAGFQVLFDHMSDFPLELTFSSSIIKVGLSTRADDIASGTETTNEFFSLPNFSFTFKTNIADHLAHGYGFKKCVLESFSSGSSPMLDIDADQLAILSYNYLVLRKLMKIRKMKAQAKEKAKGNSEGTPEMLDDSDEDTKIDDSGSDSGSQEPSVNTSSQFLDRTLSLLEQYYPKLDVKLTMEQPRALLRVHDEKLQKTHMVMVSYSMMVLHISTTKDFEYDSSCHFSHPCVTYSEKRREEDGSFKNVTEDFCGLTEARIDCRVHKYLKFKSRVALYGGLIDLTKLDVLNAINSIINETSRLIAENSRLGLINKQLDTEIWKGQNLLPPKSSNLPKAKSFNEDDLFSQLPSWLILAEFTIDDLNVQLGSASPLLPPDYISKLSEEGSREFSKTSSTSIFRIFGLKLSVGDFTGDCETSSLVSASSSSTSSETLTENATKEVFWKAFFAVEGIQLLVLDEGFKPSLVFGLDHLSSTVSSIRIDDELSLQVSSGAEELDLSIDIYKIFTIVGSVNLVLQTLVKPITELQKRLKKESQALRSGKKSKSKFNIANYLDVGFQLKRANMLLLLPNSFRLRLQNFDLICGMKEETVTVTNRFLRVMVNSPIMKGYWDRVLCLDSLSMKINDPSREELVYLETPSIKFTQPHKFIVYKLFDNFSIFLKVTKHLVQCLKLDEKPLTVSPKESPPVVLPSIKVNAGKIAFIIEDDPFESDLNMIYQLGLVEQRKRTELQNLFDERVANESNTTFDRELDELHRLFGASWIRKVKTYKQKLTEEITENKDFLLGLENDIAEEDNVKINPYVMHAPLFSMIMSGVDLDITKPRFSLRNLSQFIYDNGQKVPKDTTYNMMVPTYIRLSVKELRMHMRDYPLPMLYIPYSVDVRGQGKALMMQGHLVINEALVLEKEYLRSLKIQLTETNPRLQPNRFDKLIIEKSMSSVKLYTDMDVLFDSEAPTRFVWGQSYQFGIQQVMLKVDSFSKPPVDPSRKLGFWDKMRLVMHGNVTIRTGKTTSIEVAFKGGRDPYDLFTYSNGFVLSLRDSVEWKINEHDDSLRFFDISANRVAWYIPNYLATPLISWTRKSSKPTFLPQIKDYVTTCHGYYLTGQRSLEDIPESSRSSHYCEKEVVELSGGVSLVVGFLLQHKKPGSDKLTNDSKPHYEVNLFNPDFTEPDHDSFEGFRSSQIHMSISFSAHTKTSYNTIHLSPDAFKQFFNWWTLFRGNMMLPVRRGKVFGETKNSEKFSEHLESIKFLFDIKNLFISHVYRNEAPEHDDQFESIGVRAKVDEFLVDLHQKKQEVVTVHEDLSRQQKVKKMSMHLGKVVLTNIDLRTVHALFHHNLYNQGSKSPPRDSKGFLSVFDKDDEWYDSRDYDAAFSQYTGSSIQKVDIEPLLYSDQFMYIRDTSDSDRSELQDEENIHDCHLYDNDYYSSQIEVYQRKLAELSEYAKTSGQKQQVCERMSTLKDLISEAKSQKRKSRRSGSVISTRSQKENFHNKFILVSMFLKWNEAVRDMVLKYIHFVQLNSNSKKFLSYEMISMLEDLIQKRSPVSQNGSIYTSEKSEFVPQISETNLKSENSGDRIENFEQIIREVRDYESILEDFQIEIISPQIQLHTKDVKDSVVIITAPALESKIFSVVTKNDAQYRSKELEKRYAVLLHDASVMVVNRDKMKQNPIAFERKPYGTSSSWPPFLSIETCKNSQLAIQEDILIDQMSLMLTFEQIIASGSNIEQIEKVGDQESQSSSANGVENGANRLRVDVPKLAINSTSRQYFVLYVTFLSLLLYMEPLAVQLREKVSKMKFSIDFQDLNALYDRLMKLHEQIGVTNILLNNFNFRQNGFLDNEDLNNYLSLTNSKESMSTEIALMLHTLFSGDIFTDAAANVVQDWTIAADEIVLHMLNDDRSDILDLRIDRGVCKRLIKDDGSNDNRLEIKSIEGVNRLEDSHFSKFLEPVTTPKDQNLITVNWSMNRAIGGIKIIDNFIIDSLPLNVRIDEETGRSLMDFIFYTDDVDEIADSKVVKLSENAQEDPEKPEDKKDSASSKKKNSATSLGSSEDFVDFDKDVNSMISRSKKYYSVVKMSCKSFEVVISLRMRDGLRRWLNVTNFTLGIPEWQIEGEVISLLDIADRFKKVAIRALVKHSGSLVKNKATTRSRNLRSAIKSRTTSSRETSPSTSSESS